MTNLKTPKDVIIFIINALITWSLLFLVKKFIIPIEEMNVLFFGCLLASLFNDSYKRVIIFLLATFYIVYSNIIFSKPLDIELVHLNYLYRLAIYFSTLLLFMIIYYANKLKLITFPLLTTIIIFLVLKYAGIFYKLDFLIKMSVIWSLGSWMFVLVLKKPIAPLKDLGRILLPWQLFYQFPLVELKNKAAEVAVKKNYISKANIALVLMIIGYFVLNLGFASFEYFNGKEVSIVTYFNKLNYLSGVSPMNYFIRGLMIRNITFEMLIIHYLDGYMMILNLFCLVAFPYSLIQLCGIDISYPLQNPFQSTTYFDFFKRILGPFVSVMYNLFFIPSWNFFSKIIRSHQLRIFVVLIWVMIVGRYVVRAIPLGQMDIAGIDPTMAFLSSKRDQLGFILLMIIHTVVFYISYKMRSSSLIKNMPIVLRSFGYITCYFSTIVVANIVGNIIYFLNVNYFN